MLVALIKIKSPGQIIDGSISYSNYKNYGFDLKFDKSINLNYIQEYLRLLQICAPGLVPIYVNIVDTFEELGQSTLRGDGGFGSTGN